MHSNSHRLRRFSPSPGSLWECYADLSDCANILVGKVPRIVSAPITIIKPIYLIPGLRREIAQCSRAELRHKLPLQDTTLQLTQG
jgi:hypothetical protein